LKKKTGVSLTQKRCKCNISQPMTDPQGGTTMNFYLKINGARRHHWGDSLDADKI